MWLHSHRTACAAHRAADAQVRDFARRLRGRVRAAVPQWLVLPRGGTAGGGAATSGALVETTERLKTAPGHEVGLAAIELTPWSIFEETTLRAPTYSHVLLMYRHADAATEAYGNSSHVVLGLYRNVPQSDMELLLPHTRVSSLSARSVHLHVYVYVSCTCVRVRVRVCVYVCVCTCACVHAWHVHVWQAYVCICTAAPASPCICAAAGPFSPTSPPGHPHAFCRP